MAIKKKAKPNNITSAAAIKTVESAFTSILNVADAAGKALNSTSNDNKKLLNEAKRLSKKRAILMRKKKTATARVKKDASAINKKALKQIEKDLSTVQKDAAKVTAKKTIVSGELATLKTALKRATAYQKALATADKVLNKPAKKRRKKKVARAA